MNLAVVLEHLAVELQEIAVRQPALGLPLGRPRVAEVDIDAVDLTLIKNLRQLVGVDVDEEDVVQLCLRRALHRDDHRVCTFSTAMSSTSGSAAAVSTVKRPLPQPSSTRISFASGIKSCQRPLRS